jgi:hypothetical protein
MAPPKKEKISENTLQIISCVRVGAAREHIIIFLKMSSTRMQIYLGG